MRRWPQLGLLVLGLVVSAGPAEAQTTLRYKFKEGEKFGYTLDQKIKMTTSLMGRDFEVHKNHMADMTWQVLKVDKEGAGQIKLTFTRVKMDMDSPQGKVEVDSKKPRELTDPAGKVLSQVVSILGSLELTFTMEPTGEIKDLVLPEQVKTSLKNLPGAEGMGDLFSDEGLKKLVHGGIVLPKEAVSQGKTWKQNVDMKLPMGRIKGDLQFTYEGPEEKDGKKLEKIGVKPDYKIESAPDSPVQVT
ncbi:MAG TPA: DUF6263 family protein, partial [Gemmataceae bacterium]|nr:DUF6263 family protein [Gemmataceae bacterium]